MKCKYFNIDILHEYFLQKAHTKYNTHIEEFLNDWN